MTARPYRTEVRAEQARATRSRIIAAAHALLLRPGGYAAMTITDLARAAAVSPQTIYNSIGGKAEVVKAVWDMTIAGDEDTQPMSERPAFRKVTEAADVDTYAAAYASWVRAIEDRIGPLLSALLAHGTAGDPVLEELVAKIERERRMGNANSLTGLIAHRQLPRHHRRTDLIDAIWTLTAPEIYDRLVHRAGWTPRAYERWLAQQLTATLS
jgi:AcrR family transcriptional regulator